MLRQGAGTQKGRESTVQERRLLELLERACLEGWDCGEEPYPLLSLAEV